MQALRAVKGMTDILPEEMPAWRFIEETYRQVAAQYGFSEVRLPIVEPSALFIRSIGEATDIVEKEMYTFTDKGDKSLTLRPEGTASAARAYIQHSVYAANPTTKWMYLGPMYRRERPAKGRYRQFYQLGAEVFGDPGPYSDAELIEMLVRFVSRVGFNNVEVLVNSLGSGDTRDRYRAALVEYLTPLEDRLSEDSQRRLRTNPLRVIDSKVPADQEVAAGAPSILDYLSKDDEEHFEELQSTLRALDVPFRVDSKIVRGLDYYTRTLFELKDRSGQLGSQNTICGGGRYDGLVQSLGGPATAAVGFAIGIERLKLVLENAVAARPMDAVVVVASASCQQQACVVLRDLRAAGLRVDADLRGGSLKSQMRRANKQGVRFALIVGDQELEQGTVTVRDLEQQNQTEISAQSLASHLARVLGENP